MNAPIEITKQDPDPTTGTYRVDLWQESAEGGSYGDNARGTAYSARYLSDDGYGCADIAIFVVEDENGWYGIEEMATMGKAVDVDGTMQPDDSADIEYEPADARGFETLEQAQKVCDQKGKVDQSFALYLRERKDDN